MDTRYAAHKSHTTTFDWSDSTICTQCGIDAYSIHYTDPCPQFLQNGLSEDTDDRAEPDCLSCGRENNQYPEEPYCSSCEGIWWEKQARKTDITTACFTFFSGLMVLLHVYAAFSAKSLVGISPIALLFVCIQSLWFSYMFFSLRQRIAGSVMIFAFLADCTYLYMWISYGS